MQEMEGSVNREPTRIADGSNANVNRIKSCQNADVPNNEDWGLKVLLEPRNKDNIIEYFTHYLFQSLLIPAVLLPFMALERTRRTHGRSRRVKAGSTGYKTKLCFQNLFRTLVSCALGTTLGGLEALILNIPRLSCVM